MSKKRFPGKFKGQKGSVTLFVLISIIFFLIVLISIYIASGNKKQSQLSEIKAIQEEYNVSNDEMQEEYEDIVDKDDNVYNITYKLNGGIVSGNPSTYTEEDEDITLNNPTKKGYTFTGWTGTGLTSASMQVVIKSGSTGDRSYEANWKANTYTIVFNGNGSTSGSMSNVTMTYDETKNLPANTYVKTGYEFKGWTTNKSSSEVMYADQAEVSNLTDVNGDFVTLYAVWGISEYELTIDPNGGKYADSTEEIVIKGDYNETIDLGDIIAPDGHKVTFDGNGGDTPESLTSEKVFTEWQLEGEGTLNDTKYTFGDGDGKLTAQYEDKGITLPTSNKEGYTINGWYKDEDCTIEAGKPGENYVPENDETLFAGWTANKYTIVLDGNGATSGDRVEIDMTYDQSKELPQDAFERDGYEFIGWSSDRNATKPEYEGNETVINLTSQNNGTVTLYALWKKTITITYDANGGTGAPATQTGTIYNSQGSTNIQISDTVPTNEGYTFSGWTDDKSSSEVKYTAGGTYSFSDSTILYAVWGTNNYTLIVNPNEGTWRGTTSNTNVNGSYGQTIEIENPTPPEGYTVTFDTDEGELDISSITASKKFVEWTEEGPGNLNGTQYTFGAGSGTLTAKYETEKIILPTPEKDGYHCDEWSKDPDGNEPVGKPGEEYVPEGDETLYPVWVANSYKIKFEGNGATSGSMSDLDMTYDTPKALTSNAYQRTDYEFIGWNTNKDAQTAEYQNNEVVNNLTNENNATITLYAMWRRTITISYDANGGSGAPASQEGVMYNAQPGASIEISKEIPQRDGYTFMGWTDERESTNVKYQSGETYEFNNDTTLYAVWGIGNYVLTVDPNGGTWNGQTASSEVKGDYGTTIEIPNPVPPKGYTVTFEGDNGETLETLTTTNTFTEWTEEGEGSLTGTKYTFGAGAGKLTANYEKGTIILPPADKEGYELEEWEDEDGNPVGKPGEEYEPDGDETLKPQWKANEYTIVFDGNGSTSGNMPNLDMTYDEPKNLTPNTYVRTGYEFIGWSTNKNATSEEYADGESVNNLTSENGSTITLYALWKKTIVISYDANGGSGAPASQTGTLYNSQASVSIPISDVVPTREGYTFNGWTDDENSSNVKYVAGGTYEFSNSVVLYAVWGTNDYTLTVNPNEGTWRGTTNITNVQGVYGQTVDIEDPVPPEGYTVTFDTDEGELDETTLIASRNFVEWTEEGPGNLSGTQYTFGAGSGALTAKYQTDKIILPTPEKDGYHCDEWSKDPDGNEPVGKPGEEYVPEGDETLYPVWVANSYKIKFEGNGATSGSMSDLDMTYDTPKALTSNAYQRTDYEFIGWNTNKDAQTAEYQNNEVVNNLTNENNATITLYAMWRRTITISYDANGGSGAPASQEGVMYNAQPGASIKITEDVPTRVGYAFMGWTDEKESTNVKYQSGGTYEFNNDTTLYAVWGIENYTLTINPNGGRWNGNTDIQYVKGDYGINVEISDPEAPIGYLVTFDGNKGTSEQASITSNKVFAGWTEDGPGSLNGTTYTFGAGDGTLTARYENGEITLPNATREGYTFNGWYTATSEGTLIGKAGEKYTPSENTTLYAQWTVNSYTLTVDPNGGKWNNNSSATQVPGDYGTTTEISKPEPPEGYTVTFEGDNGEVLETLKTTNTFTEWTKEGEGTFDGTTYTFGAGDGRLIANYKKGTIILPPADKEGYELEEWEDEDGDPVGKPGEEYEPDGDETLKPQWTANKYTIIFDGNGSTSGSMSNLDMTYDEPKNLTANAYVKTGYEFIGWNTNKNATSEEYADQEIVSNLTSENGETITLYAIWKKTITISYDANGGSGAPAAQTGILYNSQASVSIKLSDTKPTREGYTFSGWTDVSGSTDIKYQAGGTYSFSNDTTLYAVWGTNNYALTIDPNGGTWNGQSSNSQVNGDYGTNVNIEDPVPPAGYTVTFDGNGGTSDSDTLTSSKYFTGWTNNSPGSISGTTYTFGAGDGTISANYEDGSINLPNAQRTGYQFIGWNNSSNQHVGNAGEEYTPQKDETLIAQWTANTYTVRFDGNGSTKGEMSDLNMTFDVPQNLPKNSFERDGYEFIGWSTDKDATTAEFAEGESINNLTTENGRTVIIYALWKKTIVITYDANGGEGAPSPSTGTIFNSQTSTNIIISDTKPTREGYTFYGWTDVQGAAQAEYQPGGTYPFSESTTLYAVWGTNSYTLTVNPNGGRWNNSPNVTQVPGDYGTTTEISNPEPPAGYLVTFDGNKGTSEQASITSNKVFAGWTEDGPGSLNGTTYTFGAGDGTLTARYENGEITLPNATREGYTFNGWYTATSEGTLIGKAGEKYTPSENTTLYAQWTVNSYTLTVDPNGGKWNNNSSATQVPGDYGTTTEISKPEPPEGYTVTFEGDNGEVLETLKTTNTFTEWTKEGEGTFDGTTYTFGAGDGRLIANYKKGTIILPPADKEGYELEEWEDEDGDPVGKPGEEYEPDGDETLKPQWTANKYTIIFDGNGSTSGSMSNLDMTYDEPKNLTANAYVKTGYEFIGWNTNKNATSEEYADQEIVSNLTSENGETITLYAIWKKTITISYDANGGSGAPAAQTGILYNSQASVSIKLSDTKPTREGYTFSGWTDVSGSTDIKYQAGGTYSFSNDTTLYAVWGTNNYALTIDPNGGTWNGQSSNSQINGDFGTTAAIQDPVPPVGYVIEFNGNGGTVDQASITSTKSFTNWTVQGPGTLNGKTYTFGAGPGKLIANYEDNSVLLPTPTREGYECTGWFTEATGGLEIGKPGGSYTPAFGQTLYAQWKANTYTIKFDGNTATSGSMQDLQMTYDSAQNLTQNAYKKDGYEFIGWSTNKDAITPEYTDGQSVSNLTSENGEVVTLYALWKKTIVITYDANGGQGAPGSQTGTIYNSQTSVDMILSDTEPTREGYTFYGWTDVKGSTVVKYQAGGTYKFSDSVTLYAIWGTNSYTLTIDPNGGKWNNSSSIVEVPGDYGTTTEIANPTPPTGYKVTFDSDGGTTPQSITSTKSFIDWTKEGEGTLTGTTYTFGAGDGKLTANYKEDAIILPDSTKDGYTVEGWYDDEDQKVGDVNDPYTPTEDETLHVKWKANTYKIHFDGNGATGGSMSDLEMTYDQAQNLTTNKYTKTGYTFIGWNTDKDLTTVKYTDGQSVNNLTTENGATITIYAIWQKEITISYDANGGAGAPASQKGILYNSQANVSMDLSDTKPTREGYTFLGWARTSNATSAEFASGGTYEFSDNITLYAVWDANSYMLTVNPNGGTWNGSQDSQSFTQDYGTTKTIGNPTSAPQGYTVTFDSDGGTTPQPITSTKSFVRWIKEGAGTFDGTTYTFGAGTGTLTAEYKNNEITLPDSTKDGYTVDGWYNDEDQKVGNVNDPYTPTEDETLHIKWKANTYKIHFDGNGATGGSMSDLEMTYDQAKNLTANGYTKTGYTFIGWNTDKNETTAQYTNGQSVNNLTTENGATITIYAIWQKEITISYNANGGTGAPASQKGILYNSQANVNITLSDTEPTRNGYTFVGWSESNSSTTASYEPGEEYPFSKDTTLYAVWDANSYTLIVDPNGGIWNGSSNTQSFTQDYGTTKTIADPTSAPAGYRVTFNGNGGSTPNPITSTKSFSKWGLTGEGIFNGTTYTFGAGTGTLTANYTNNAITLPAATREGYKFDGWYTEQNTGQKVGNAGEDYVPNEATTLYAHWTIQSYTLTVNPNGGTWNGQTGNSTFTQNYGTTKTIANPEPPAGYKVTFDGNTGTAGQSSITSTKSFVNWTEEGPGTLAGTTYTFGAGAGTLTANYANNAITLPTATKEGYHCIGWFTSANGGEKRGDVGGSYTPTSEETLYAHWEANTYTIVFNSNGGSGNMSDLIMTYDTPKNLTKNAFTKTGYEFVGWDQNNSAITAQYADEASVNNLSFENGGIVTLYAIWKKEITVSYNANGGSGAPGQQTGTMYNAETSTDIVLSDTVPTREGYTFNGWTDVQGSTSVKYQPGGTYAFSDNTTLYAVWGTNSYTLTVDPNGGTWNGQTTSSEVKGDYGSTTTISDPTPPVGYTISFDGNGGSKPDAIISTKSFRNWTEEGPGTLSGTTYTFGAGAGKLTANYTDNSIVLPSTTREGYHCTGWYTLANGGEKRGDVGESYTPTSAETLYAHWEANTYTIVFNSNGGSGNMSDLIMTYDTPKNLTKNAFTKTGYEFVGWDQNNSAITAQYADEASVNNLSFENGGIVTLYAIWKKEITVSYNANGGSGAPSSESNTVFNDETSADFKISTVEPVRTGYTFIGWATSSTATSARYLPGETYSFSTDTELFAVWDVNEYTLTINPNGGRYNGTDENTEIKGDYNSTITVSNPTPPTGYTVTFDSDGGSTVAAKTSTKTFDSWTQSGVGVLNGSTYTFGAGDDSLLANYKNGSIELPTVTKTGYVFDGWYTLGGSKVGNAGENYTPNAAITLYAHWTIENYTLTINPNGGRYNDTNESTEIKGDYNSTVTISNPTPPTGYTVTFNDAGGIVSESTITSTKTFTNWTEEGPGTLSGTTYTFGAGSGTLTANYVDNDITLPELVPPEGYHFVGWYTEETEGTYVGDEGDSYMPTSSQTLYAHIEANTYTIRFNANGGTGTMSDYEKTYGRDSSLPNNKYTKTNYQFIGWNTSRTAQSAQYTDGQTITTDLTSTDGDVIPLYAIWRKTITITYNANGGTGAPATQTANVYNSTTSATFTLKTTKPTRSLYIFEGWSTDRNADLNEVEYEPGDRVTTSTNLTLYAIWTPAVAQIGNNLYRSINDAFDNVPTTGAETEVVLLRDWSETNNPIDERVSASLSENKNVFLNLNGYTLECPLFNSGTLKVQGNGGTLEVTNNYTGNRAAIYSSGTCEIIDGKFSISSDVYGWTIVNDFNGTMTINDGEFYKYGGGAAIYNKSKLTMNGGYVESEDYGIVSAANDSTYNDDASYPYPVANIYNTKVRGKTAVQAGSVEENTDKSYRGKMYVYNSDISTTQLNGGEGYADASLVDEAQSCLILYDDNVNNEKVTSNEIFEGNVTRVAIYSNYYNIVVYDIDPTLMWVFGISTEANGDDDWESAAGTIWTNPNRAYYQVLKSKHNNESGTYGNTVYIYQNETYIPQFFFRVEMP